MPSKQEYNIIPNINIPIDYFYIVYLIMFYEGIGNLFPWNAFITASTYYAERFCGTVFESNFENFFSITYTLSQTIGLALSIVYQNEISLTNKVIWPLLLYSSIFGLTTALVAIQDIDPTLLFWITLISSSLCGMCGALLSAGLFGLAAMLPPAYTGAMMNGQAVAGLIVACSGLLTLLASPSTADCDDDDNNDDDDGDECPQTIDYSALAYFIIATIILLGCALSFLFLGQLSFTKYYIARSLGEGAFLDDGESSDEDSVGSFGRVNTEQQNNNGVEEESEFISNPITAAEEDHRDRRSSSNLSVIDVRNSQHSSEHNRDSIIIDSRGRSQSERAELRRLDSSKAIPLAPNKIWRIYSMIRIPSLSVFLVFSVTIGLFPSLIVLLESTEKCGSNDNRFTNDLFVPFFFVLFNLFDLCGRIPAGLYTPLFTKDNIWMPAVGRFVFFPLFLLCNVSNSQLPVVFNHDAFPIIFMILLAFTNGYVASNSMILGATATNAKDAPIAGTMMIFSLTVGLFMGASLSFIVVLISQGSI